LWALFAPPFPSPIGLAASFDTGIVIKVANVMASEAEGLGITHIAFARESSWAQVEENVEKIHFLPVK
jgi:beta-glucosidase